MSSFFDNHLGIQICKDRIRLVEVVYKEDDLYLENVAEQKLEKSIEKFSDLTGILQNAYDEVKAKKQFNSKIVSYTFPPSFYKVFEIPYDKKLLAGDLKEHLDWELRKQYPYDSDTDYLVKNIQYQSDFFDRGDYLGAIALPRPFIVEIVKFSKLNHLSVKFIDHPQNAANVFLSQCIPDFKAKNGVTIYLGSEAVSIMFLASGSSAFIKQYTYDSLGDLQSKLDKACNRFVDYGYELKDVDYICIAGESASEQLINKVTELFEKDVDIVNPFDKIKFSSRDESVQEFSESASGFAAPTGLALRLM